MKCITHTPDGKRGMTMCVQGAGVVRATSTAAGPAAQSAAWAKCPAAGGSLRSHCLIVGGRAAVNPSPDLIEARLFVRNHRQLGTRLLVTSDRRVGRQMARLLCHCDCHVTMHFVASWQSLFGTPVFFWW